MSAIVQHASMPQYQARVSAPSPMTLTNRELIEEADALTRRMIRQPDSARDVALVQQLAARLGSKS